MHGKDEFEQEKNDDKCMIIVPVSLLAKIDLNRDKLSRAEFIELCIDTLTERGDEEGAEHIAGMFPAYRVAQQNKLTGSNVTRNEFEDLKSGIKDTLRAFVESLPQHMADSWTQATSDAEERSKQLMELLDD
jgi:hypothetical protein